MSRAVFTRFHLRERIRDRDAAVYGILLIAALLFPIIDIYATGGTADVSQAVAAMTRRRQVDPVPGERAEYEERYHRWREVYGKLTGWTL